MLRCGPAREPVKSGLFQRQSLLAKTAGMRGGEVRPHDAPRMTTHSARTISASIDCPPERVYAFAVDPANFPRWATSFVQGARRADAGWVLDTPAGAMGSASSSRTISACWTTT